MIRLRRRWEREDITMKVAEKLIEGGDGEDNFEEIMAEIFDDDFY